MEQQEQILPKGWTKTSLGELGEYINGFAFKPKDWGTKGKPIIRIQNLTNSEKEYNYATRVIDPRYDVKKGDILVSWSATLDAFIWHGADALLNQHIFKVVPSKFLDKSFVFYLLKHNIYELVKSEHLHGTTMKHINRKPFLGHSILLPPINEQKRISDKIEMLFSDLDKGEENLRTAQQLLSSYRQSVLKAAVTGELTRDWRTTEKLSDWQKLCLDEVIISKPRNGYSPKGVDYETPVKNLTLTATTSGTFKPKCFKYVDVQIAEDSHLWLEDGDILIQRANSIEYVGVSAIYRGAKHEFIYPDLMMKVQANKKLIKSEFLYLVLSADITRKYFTSNATGTAGSMPKINQKIVMETPLLLPSLPEQDILIDKVEDIFSRIFTLEAWCKTELKRSETLRQSILKSAFSGQLVPQDAADEPASELLKRIQADHTTGAKTKPTAKRGRGKQEAA